MKSKPKLDSLDKKILRTLLEDSKTPNNQLADKVGLSTSQCWQRVRHLEAEGYIEGYSANLSQARLGHPDLVLIEITLDRHDDEILEQFGRAMAELPQVLEVHLTTGEYDYLVKVAVSGTLGYEEFLRKHLYKVPGIRHSRSSFALRCLKRVQAFVPE